MVMPGLAADLVTNIQHGIHFSAKGESVGGACYHQGEVGKAQFPKTEAHKAEIAHKAEKHVLPTRPRPGTSRVESTSFPSLRCRAGFCTEQQLGSHCLTQKGTRNTYRPRYFAA